MRLMRRQVFEHDIDHWARAFLDDLERVTSDHVDWPGRAPRHRGDDPVG